MTQKHLLLACNIIEKSLLRSYLPANFENFWKIAFKHNTSGWQLLYFTCSRYFKPKISLSTKSKLSKPRTISVNFQNRTLWIWFPYKPFEIINSSKWHTLHTRRASLLQNIKCRRKKSNVNTSGKRKIHSEKSFE